MHKVELDTLIMAVESATEEQHKAMEDGETVLVETVFGAVNLTAYDTGFDIAYEGVYA